MRDGLGQTARYGTNAGSFAQAIVESVEAAEAVGEEDRQAFYRENSWDARVEDCKGLLAKLFSMS